MDNQSSLIGIATENNPSAKLSNCSIGVWEPEIGKIRLCVRVGKLISNMGHRESGSWYLFIEEAAFLAFRGVLEVIGHKSKVQPLSFEELLTFAPSLPPTTSISQDSLLLYIKMRSWGYILHRLPSLSQFALWNPSASQTFQISSPPPPHFILHLVHIEEPLSSSSPSSLQLQWNESVLEVPIRYAMLDNGVFSFYALDTSFSLPQTSFKSG